VRKEGGEEEREEGPNLATLKASQSLWKFSEDHGGENAENEADTAGGCRTTGGIF
jgi:hypothetical protein